MNILTTEQNVYMGWENLDLGRVYRPHCVRSAVFTTSGKILPYRPPARLIRTKHHIPSPASDPTNNVVIDKVSKFLESSRFVLLVFFNADFFRLSNLP